jgi:hypothetical protein
MANTKRDYLPSDTVSTSMSAIKLKCKDNATSSTDSLSAAGQISDEQAIFDKFLGKGAAADQAPSPSSAPPVNYDDEVADRVRQSHMKVDRRTFNAPEGSDPVAPHSITEITDASGKRIAAQG